MATITVGKGNHTVNVGSNLTLIVGNGDDTITAGDNDIITVGRGTDVITIGSNDTLTVGDGNDTIFAGNNDIITVGDGANTIGGGANSVIVAGVSSIGSGNGQATGKGKSNTVTAGPNSTITVGDGVNNITAGDGSTITADQVGPGQGNNEKNDSNTIVTGKDSTVTTGGGLNTITAGPHSTINAGGGDDTVFAGGNSTIGLGYGVDRVHAGTSDIITLAAAPHPGNFGSAADSGPLVKIDYDGLTPSFTVPGSLSVDEEHSIGLSISLLPPALGNEVVNGFDTAHDVIGFDTADFANFATVMADASQVGSNTVITLDASDTVTLTNVTKSSLTAANFEFFTGTDTITITGVPLDETLSAGLNNGGGSWSLTPGQLAGLQLNAGEPIGFPTPVDLTVTMTNAAGQGATSSQSIPLVVNPIPPTLGISVLAPHAGDPVTETRLMVTASADDPDGGNDFINRLAFSGVPAGVTLTHSGLPIGSSVSTTGQPGTFSYEVDVNAPAGKTTNFNLGVTDFSDEPNAPEVSTTQSQNIDVEFSTVNANPLFTSTNQSIWSEGNAFSLSDHRFLGLDYPTGFPPAAPASTSTSLAGVSFGVSFGVKAGFQSDLSLNAGAFNGSLPFNIMLDNTYNKTNDTLELDPANVSQGTGSFNTTGPNGSYSLAFIYDLFANAFAGPFSTSLNPSGNVPLVNFASSTAKTTLSLPDGIGSVTFQWPNVDTSGSGAGTTISASKTSDPIVQLSIDPIAVISDIVFGSDPFKNSIGGTGFSLGYTLLAGTVAPGVDLKQAFSLFDNGLTPMLQTTGGHNVAFSLTSPTVINNASSLDTSPGTIGFNLGLTPNTDLQNDTSLAGQLALGIKALAVHGSILGIGTTIGPLIQFTTKIPLGNFNLYKNTFPVAFNPQNVAFSV